MPIRMTYDARQLEKIQKMIQDLPIGAKSVVIPALNEYLMGGKGGEGGAAWHGLKHYPPFRAWPWGEKDPHRTGRLQRGWDVVGEAYRQHITNPVPYAKWIHGNETQTWRAIYGGWRRLEDIVKSNINGAMRSAMSELKKWIAGKLRK